MGKEPLARIRGTSRNSLMVDRRTFEAVAQTTVAKEKISNPESAVLRHSNLLIAVVLLILTLAMFGDVLLVPGDRVLSEPGADLSSEFVYWRQFGYQQLRTGHLALWNPHVFGGVPFLGGFQSALLYPPNLIYLILPLAKAINCEIALHVFLLGLFMSMWVQYYNLHPAAVLLASVSTMFGGAFFLHIFPGHLATLDAMAWAPLILLTLDELFDDPLPTWVFVGIFAFTMEVLAGHPQTLFNLLVTCILYGVLRLSDAPRLRSTILSLAIVGTGTIAMTAVQLWTGLQAVSEGTRQGGVSYAFAASLSFPPQNFLTMAVPGFFGNLTELPYWGADYLWEMCPFLGLAGLSMAISALFGKSQRRLVWMAMALLLFWIALADNTFLFAILFRYVPGFDHFRCHSKFIFEAVLFLAMLAGLGTDGLLRSARGAKVGASALILGALILGAVGVSLSYEIPMAGFIPTWSYSSGELDSTRYLLRQASLSYSASDVGGAEGFAAETARFSGHQCLRSAAVLLVLGAILFLRCAEPKAAYLLVVVGVVEMFAFAHSTLTTFSLAQTIPTATRQFLADHPGDYRILQVPTEFQANSAMVIDAQDIWGYDPMVLKRYAQLIGYSQGQSPDDVDMYLNFLHFGRLLGLARLQYILISVGSKLQVVERVGALPHLLLMSEWIHMVDRDHMLATLNSKAFDCTKTAILESEPDPRPSPGPSNGTARILHRDPDSIVISAEVLKPTLLLITDCYSRYWRAVPLPRSSQTSYQVLPADYAFMAVPLAAGSHLIRLEYRPSGYTIGRWVSIGALAAYLTALGVFFERKRRAQRP